MKVAKLVIIDAEGKYLLLERTNHPRFFNDPDLPGGTVETGETPLQGMIREVFEEIGVVVNPEKVMELYAGTTYSHHGTHYSLFSVNLITRPEVKLSWEHTAYTWLSREAFLAAIKSSSDTYLDMVYDTLTMTTQQ